MPVRSTITVSARSRVLQADIHQVFILLGDDRRHWKDPSFPSHCSSHMGDSLKHTGMLRAFVRMLFSRCCSHLFSSDICYLSYDSLYELSALELSGGLFAALVVAPHQRRDPKGSECHPASINCSINSSMCNDIDSYSHLCATHLGLQAFLLNLPKSS